MSTRNVEPSHWVGVDVSKPFFDAALLRQVDQEAGRALRDLPTGRFKRSPEGVTQFVAWLQEQLGEDFSFHDVRVVMEATSTYSSELAVWLLNHPSPLSSAIVNPQPASHFIKSLALRNQTDRLAARALALYGAQRRPAPYEPPSQEEAELREMVRYRHFLVEQRTAMKNQAGNGPSSCFVKEMQQRQRKQLTDDIAILERQMRETVAQDDELSEDIALLESIYGVAFVTAITVRMELGDLRRFARARQLTAFAGLSPREITSGTSVRKSTRMSKTGNTRVRAVLYMAACAAISRPNPWRTVRQEYVDNGKRPMQAIGVIMRKLLVLMRAILISRKPYNPNRIRRKEIVIET